MNFDQKNKARLVGILIVAASLFLLTGSVAVVSGAGRYELQSWSYSDGMGSGQYGAFVIDTATGVTKIVYQAEINAQSQLAIKNSLGKQFSFYDDEFEMPENIQSIKDSNKFNRKSLKNIPE